MLRIFRPSLMLACTALLVPGAANAATDGTLGATSTGSVGISATIPARARITKLTDIAFGTVDPLIAASSSENVCVWSNTSGQGYSITATGSGSGSAFTLTDGSNTLNYSVEWAGTSGAPSGTALTAGTALGGLTTTAVNPTCSTGPATTATLFVKMTAANLQAAVANAYTGTLTLVVAPQ